jgi:hypothetical protein
MVSEEPRWANCEELRELMSVHGEEIEIVEDRVVDEGELTSSGRGWCGAPGAPQRSPNQLERWR